MAESGWISVKERLPKTGVDVLTYVPTKWGAKFIRQDHVTGYSGNWPRTHPCLANRDKWFMYDREGYVTHWQPLPEPPK